MVSKFKVQSSKFKVKVKICGITNLEDAINIAKLKPDALGFVFFKRSPRYISESKAGQITKKIPSSIKKVGVFVNEKESTIKRIAEKLKLDFLQFHGNEAASFCRKFRGYKIIKAFRIKNSDSLLGIAGYPAWAFMLDNYQVKLFGGTGKAFDWSIVNKKKVPKKTFFLSGGLNCNNVNKAIKLLRPDWVDVSSGVELKTGKKSINQVKRFIEIARKSV